MGPCPRTMQGNKDILTVTDQLLKWVEAFPLPNATADAVVQKLEEEVCSRYRVSRCLVVDNGTQFKTNLFRGSCDHSGVEVDDTGILDVG